MKEEYVKNKDENESDLVPLSNSILKSIGNP